MKKNLVFLLLLFSLHLQFFAYNENDQGFPISHDLGHFYDPYVNSQLNRQADELENALSAVASANNQVSVPEDTSNLQVNVNDVSAQLDQEITQAEEASIKETADNIDASIAEEDIMNSESRGDPVKIAQGSYEQSESDIERGNNLPVQVIRSYSSENKMTSSFGYGWSSNLDERIILGINAGTEAVEEAYRKRIEKLTEIKKSIEDQIKRAYDVTDVQTALSNLNSNIQRSDTNYSNASSIASSLSSLESSAQGYPAQSRIASIKESAESLVKTISGKNSSLQACLKRLKTKISALEKIDQKLITAQTELMQFIILNRKTEVRRERNFYVRFKGMPACYEETGDNTITFIDQNSYPHIFYETEEGSGVWKNSGEKEILECHEINGGIELVQRDGIKKLFDEAGFLIEQKDRNNNFITISRFSDGKIKQVESSFGEKFSFTYNNNFISKITNIRDSGEEINYYYQADKLVQIKDSENDSTKMKYKENGTLTNIIKCDGSEISFTYSQHTADGRLLTTASCNEEGFSENFDYFIDERKTVYTDHDGNKTITYYDQRNRSIREILPDNSVIENQYDSSGNLIKSFQNSNPTYFEYDALGNKTRVSYCDDSYETFSYNTFNELEYYRDRDGIIYEYLHDHKGNLIEYRIGGVKVFNQEFDKRGNVTKRTVYGDKDIITEFEYDDFANLISQSCGSKKIVYEYDKRNRLSQILQDKKPLSSFSYKNKETKRIDNNGLETTYINNGRKDITTIIEKDTLTGFIHKTRIEYDKRHLPLKVFAGDGQNETLIAEYSYTPEGKIKSQSSGKNLSLAKSFEYQNGQLNKILTGEGDLIFSYNYQILSNKGQLVRVSDANNNTSIYEYDLWGKLINQTDANGEITQNIWSGAGRLKKTQNSYGGFYLYEYNQAGLIKNQGEENGDYISWTYNPDGTVKTKTDLYKNTSYYSYDNQGRLICKKEAAASTFYEYDKSGHIIKESVSNPQKQNQVLYYVNYEYSDNERIITCIEGGKYKKIRELDAFGNIIKETDGNGNIRHYEYDYLNHLVAAYDAYENKTSYEYETDGKIKSIILPDGSRTDYTYNSLGLPVKISDDCGCIYSAQYDNAGRLIKEESRADCQYQYEYDGTGRLTKIICGGQTLQEYSYSQRGKVLTVKDGKGFDYLYYYDSFGRLVKETNRLGLSQKYFYDKAGVLNKEESFDDSKTIITYSQDRTCKKVQYSDGSENLFIYDGLGNIIQMQNAYGTSLYEYDLGGRLIAQKELTSGEEIFFEYDPAGNRSRLYSSNRETRYYYGKNNEVKEIFDNKQRVSVQLEYNKNGKEILRKFGNGTSLHTLYDKAGRISAKVQKSERNELLWGEAYLYGQDGKRSASVDKDGFVTLYEYNKQGQLSVIYYPYSQALADSLMEEAQTNGLATLNEIGENKYLPAAIKDQLISLMNSMQYTLASNLKNFQLFIKEAYAYDKNGNRVSKATKYGTINYNYDKENRLVSSGSHGQTYVTCSYDKEGNLVKEESALKSKTYSYNSQNRLIFCQTRDDSKMEFAQTSYAYDAFGRRVIVQDMGEAALRTLYDGLTFDVIKQSPTFENGLFTDYYDRGIRHEMSGRPTGDRYRFIDDKETPEDERYFYDEEQNYKRIKNRYIGERSLICINGTIAAQTISEGSSYFSTDLLGSVRTADSDTSYGYQLDTYNYDAFGNLIQGNLTGSSDFGYLGKQQDPTALLYNYGYRDYSPQQSRFTTPDPIRDGPNWYTYCNSDPVNFVDLWGLFYYRGTAQKSSSAYKKTEVYIYRNQDGLGNSFDSTRMIFKNGECVYVDQVGANCSEQYYDGISNFTEPDGVYYYTFSGLTPNGDGTYDSESYHNTIRHKTDDPNIPIEIRNAINDSPGNFLEHGNQKKGKDVYSTTNPFGAGCTIGQGGQEHQDEFMEVLMDGVDRPEEIKKVIITVNKTTYEKGD